MTHPAGRKRRADEELTGEALTKAIDAALAAEVGLDDSNAAAVGASRRFLLTTDEWEADAGPTQR